MPLLQSILNPEAILVLMHFNQIKSFLFSKYSSSELKPKPNAFVMSPHQPFLFTLSYLCELISYYFPYYYYLHSLYSNVTWGHLNFFVYFQHILISVSHFRKGKLFFPFLELSFECFSNLLIHVFTLVPSTDLLTYFCDFFLNNKIF